MIVQNHDFKTQVNCYRIELSDIYFTRNKLKMALIPIETGDGSRTIFDTGRMLYFRSLQGAGSESAYVFLESSQLTQWPVWRVLELGFGTALNFLTTAQAWLQQGADQPLDYHVVESQPLEPEIFAALKYTSHFDSQLVALVSTVLEAAAQQRAPVSHSYQQLCLNLYPCSWEAASLAPELEVQAIYHDPFGPKANPECWTPACFAWSSRHLHPAGRLVTYAAATQVRKAMVAAGLVVASLPGSGTKREMTLAAHHSEALSGTTLLNQSRYQP